MTVKGATSCNERMHKWTKKPPLNIFGLASDKLIGEELRRKAESVHATLHLQCRRHLDPFTKTWLHDHGSTVEQLIKSRRTSKAIGKRAKLAIFQAECAHASVRQNDLNAKGKSPNFVTASIGQLLQKIHRRHCMRFGYRSTADYWEATARRSKSNHWYVKSTILKLKRKRVGSNGWTLFRRARFISLRVAYPQQRLLNRHPQIELTVSREWSALSAAEKHEWGRKAIRQNGFRRIAARRRHDLDANAVDVSSIAPTISEVPWFDLGAADDAGQPILPQHLAQVRSAGISRANARNRIADQHKIVDARPGLAQHMAHIRESRAEPYCLKVGFCTEEHDQLHETLYQKSFVCHKVLQACICLERNLGLSAAALKTESICLLLHGASKLPPGVAVEGASANTVVKVYRMFLMVGRQMLNPRSTGFVQMSPCIYQDGRLRPDGRFTLEDGWHVLTSTLAKAQEIAGVMPTHLQIVPPETRRWTFWSSEKIASRVATRHIQLGPCFSVGTLKHHWQARNCIRLCPEDVDRVEKHVSLWPSVHGGSGGLAIDPLEALARIEEEAVKEDIGDLDEDHLDQDPISAELNEEFSAHLSFEMDIIRHMEAVHRARGRAKPNPAAQVEVRKGRSHWVVWSGDRLMGKISFPIHWDPPCVAAHCYSPSHGDKCQLALPITSSNEQLLVDWLMAQDLHSSGPAHRAGGPPAARKVNP